MMTVSMYVRVCAFIDACIFVYRYACVCMHAYAFACMHACMKHDGPNRCLRGWSGVVSDLALFLSCDLNSTFRSISLPAHGNSIHIPVNHCVG